jgi:hypothetical protein
MGHSVAARPAAMMMPVPGSHAAGRHEASEPSRTGPHVTIAAAAGPPAGRPAGHPGTATSPLTERT